MNFNKIAHVLDGMLSNNKPIDKVTDVMFDMDNEIRWYKHGRLHRLDGPAVIDEEGHMAWYKDGQLHCLSGPAKIDAYDSRKNRWYKNGEFHRLDGPAYTEGGKEYWYKDGQLHREDGPAIIDLRSGRCEWYKHGVIHREDGPAIYDNDHPEDSERNLGKIAEEFRDLLIKVRDAKDDSERGAHIVEVKHIWDDFADTTETDRWYTEDDTPIRNIKFGYFINGKRVTEGDFTIANVGLADLL
jgi:hypothetical protein